MRDGLVTDSDQLAAELKRLFAEHKFSKRVRVGLATPRTVLRVIDLPPLEDKDIRTALKVQAQERIPMPLDRAVLDFQKVGLVDTPEGQRLRVIVVATEREGVDQLLDTLRRAGLKPEGIDLSVFSVIRALGHLRQDDGPVLYAQLGDLVNIAIAEIGVCRFTRQAPQGLAMVLGRLAENRGIPVEQAHAILNGADTDDVHDGDLPAADLLKRTAMELGSELRAAAEFYSSQFDSGIVTTGVVAGALAPLPGSWKRCRPRQGWSSPVARSSAPPTTHSVMSTPGSCRWPPDLRWERCLRWTPSTSSRPTPASAAPTSRRAR